MASIVERNDSPIYNTMFKAKIGVYKLDAADRERGLAGALFEVRDASGRLFDTITTGAKGYSTPHSLKQAAPQTIAAS